MRFPSSLKMRDRKVYDECRISSRHYLYARHKSGYGWREGDDFPDLSKIASDQSFNWSAFSIPIWVRFNPEKEYLSAYGIVGYSVRTIKNINNYVNHIPRKAVGVKHCPVESNYSHCELYMEHKTLTGKSKMSKANKMKVRHALVNGYKAKIHPNEELGPFSILKFFLLMYRDRLELLLQKRCKDNESGGQ